MGSQNAVYNDHSTQTYQDVLLAIYRDNFGRVDINASNGAGRLVVSTTNINQSTKAGDILDPKFITEQAHRILNLNIQTDPRFKFEAQTSTQKTMEQAINQVMRELPPSYQLTDIIPNRIPRPDTSISPRKESYYRDHCYKNIPQDTVTEFYREHCYKNTPRDTVPDTMQNNIANHVDIYNANANMIVPNATFTTFSNTIPNSVDVNAGHSVQM